MKRAPPKRKRSTPLVGDMLRPRKVVTVKRARVMHPVERTPETRPLDVAASDLPVQTRVHHVAAPTRAPDLVVPRNLVPYLESSIAAQRQAEFQAATMPLEQKRKPEKAYFTWKLCVELRPNEMHALRIRAHKCEANRPWHVVKEELETTLQLAVLKQNKKNLNYSSLVAYPLAQWRQIKEPRNVLFSSRTRHRPIAAETVIQEGDHLVVVRLPTALVRVLYKEVKTLRFDESMTEEQRIEQVLAFDTTKHKATSRDDRYPPAHYQCHNCGQPGHWRKDCDSGRRMAPKGIPKAFLKPASFDPHQFSTLPVYVDASGGAVEPVYPTYMFPRTE